MIFSVLGLIFAVNISKMIHTSREDSKKTKRTKLIELLMLDYLGFKEKYLEKTLDWLKKEGYILPPVKDTRQ